MLIDASETGPTAVVNEAVCTVDVKALLPVPLERTGEAFELLERGETVARGKHERDKYINVPLGGGTFKRSQKYVPVMERTRLDKVEDINERWRTARELKLLKVGEKSESQVAGVENSESS